MDPKLKIKVEEMIANGYSEQEIAYFIRQYTKPKLSFNDKVWVFIVFILSSAISFFVALPIILGIRELDIIYSTDTTVTIVCLILGLFSGYIIAKRTIRKNNINNFRFYSILILKHITELIFPTILAFLFSFFIDTKEFSGDKHFVIILVSIIFYLIVIVEWIRRRVDQESRPLYFNFLYIIVLIIAFILAIWFTYQIIEVKPTRY